MANRFWVGGTNTWNATAGIKWATTSGGVGGAAVPTATDDVFFDGIATGGGSAGVITVTVGAASVCLSINFTGFVATSTFAGASTLAISGNLIWGAGMNRTYTGAITFNSTAAQTITCNSITFGGTVTLNGTGSWTMQDALVSSSTITHSQGTFATGNFGLTCTTFASSNTNTRTLSLGSSLVTLTGTGVVWNTNIVTGLTFSATTANFIVNNASASSKTFTGGTGQTVGDITFTGGGAGLLTFNGVPPTFRDMFMSNAGGGGVAMTAPSPGLSCRNLDFTGFTGTWSGTSPLAVSGSFTLGAAMTCTYTGTITFTATSGTNTLTSNGVPQAAIIIFNGAGGSWTQADAFSTTNTFALTAGSYTTNGKSLTCLGLTATGALTRSLTVDNSTVTITGLNSVTLASTGLTFSNTNTLWKFTYSGATARTFTAAGFTIADVAVTAGTGTFSFSGTRHSMDFTGYTGQWLGTVDIFTGNLTLDPGMTVQATTGNTTFAGTSGTQTITTHGVSLDRMVIFDGVGGTFQLADNLLMASNRQINLLNGTLDANNHNVTTGIFTSNIANTRTLLLGTGTWTITGFNVNNEAWVVNSTGLTLTPSSSVVLLNEGSAAQKKFRGGGTAYNVVRFGGTGSGVFTLSDNNTIASLEIVSPPHTLQIAAGSVQTVAALGLSGTAGNKNSITSDTPGVQATLTRPANDIIQDYLSLTDMILTGGARWFMGKHSDAANSNGYRLTSLYRSSA